MASTTRLDEILNDIAVLVASRPQEDFDDEDVLDGALNAANALGEKLAVAARRRRIAR